MRHYLIATHGMLADGFKHTLGLLAGNSDRVEVITAYMDNIPVEELARNFLESLKEEDEVIIFTDILGGSVNQYFMTLLDKPHFHLIAGVNMPLIIAMMFLPEEDYLEEETIVRELEESRNQMIYVNQYIRKVMLDEDLEC
jgi:Phosphotransferase system, mannose/fructose-specific component IIA